MSHDFKSNFSSWQTKKSPHLQNNLIQPLWSINHFWLVSFSLIFFLHLHRYFQWTGSDEPSYVLSSTAMENFPKVSIALISSGFLCPQKFTPKMLSVHFVGKRVRVVLKSYALYLGIENLVFNAQFRRKMNYFKNMKTVLLYEYVKQYR